MIIPLEEGRMKLLKGLLIIGLITLFHLAHGQDSIQVSLDSIVITADRLSSNISNSVKSVSKIEASELILKKPLRSFSEFTTSIPGLYISNDYNASQDLRISMRGFGSRSAFGIRGIKILVDGIPETTADGQGQIDHLTLNDIATIEVLRGPNASLFGNAAGGAIAIESSSFKDIPKLELISRFGSYGQQSLGLKSGIGRGESGGVLAMMYNHSNGYREHSESSQFNIAGRWRQKIRNGYLKFGLEFTNSPTGQDPGGVNLDQVLTAPQSARDRNVLFNAGEEINRWKTWAAVESEISQGLKLKSNAFYSNRNFTGRLPFSDGGYIELGRAYGGHGSQLIWHRNGNHAVNKFLIGYDIVLQTDDRQRFVNDDGLMGPLTLDQDEIFKGIGIYLLERYRFKSWTIEGGLRWDKNKLELVDRFLDNGDDAGEIVLNNWNPSFGLNYKLGAKANLYASYSRNFETPTLNELSNNPNGQGFNSDLKAQQSSSIEFGIRQLATTSPLNFDLTFYHINANNETLPFELAEFPGRTFYRNAGATRRVGLESSMRYALSPFWRAELNYSLGSFEFKEYLIDGVNLEGNSFPGVPEQFGAVIITYDRSGWFGQLTWDHAGELFVNDNNTVTVDARNRVQISLSRDIEIEKGKLIPSISIQNIFNEFYYDNIRINAFGGRYYEAGPARIVTIGLAYQIY